MKILLSKLTLLFWFVSAPNPDLSQFIKFTVRNFSPSESVQRVCTWQYAIIKLTVNKENKVMDVKVLNDVSNEMKLSFDYLKQYQFNRKQHYDGRSLIFCLSMENTRLQNCDITRPNGYTHAKAKDVLIKFCQNHSKMVKKSIILYDNFTAYFYEPVY